MEYKPGIRSVDEILEQQRKEVGEAEIEILRILAKLDGKGLRSEALQLAKHIVEADLLMPGVLEAVLAARVENTAL
jgi:hypothetical protein